MVDLVISIINYKTAALTAKCLESILEKKWKVNFQVWLVDNASNDGSLEYLKEKFPSVNFIESKKNGGFAYGHNLVLKKVEAKNYLILNSDTEILGDTLDKMIDFLGSHTEVGLASCKVLGFDGVLQPNGGDLPLGLALLNWLFNLETLGIKKPAFHRTDSKYYETSHEVGWISGNFMLVRNEVIKKIGYLNDDYFMYFEDVEFCFRVKKTGFKIMINPEVSIKHISGGSLDNPRFRQWSGEYKGLVRFYKDQFGIFGSWYIKLLIYTSTILRITAFAFVGKFNYSYTYAKVITSF